MSHLVSSLLRHKAALPISSCLKISSTLSQNIFISKCFSSETKPPPSDDVRERARQRIADVEAQLLTSPNSPIGILDRSPGTDPNAAESVVTSASEGQTNVIDTESAFSPFPNNTNPNTGEVKGPTGPEPTRYGDWERKGRCSDF